MKYENLDQAVNIAAQIKKHQKMLDDLSNDSVNAPWVIVKSFGDIKYTIGTEHGSEHEYSQQARELIDHIKGDLTLRIINLKQMLENL